MSITCLQNCLTAVYITKKSLSTYVPTVFWLHRRIIDQIWIMKNMWPKRLIGPLGDIPRSSPSTATRPGSCRSCSVRPAPAGTVWPGSSRAQRSICAAPRPVCSTCSCSARTTACCPERSSPSGWTGPLLSWRARTGGYRYGGAGGGETDQRSEL